jgi:L-fuconolactonase
VTEPELALVDAHVHFLDPRVLRYPWLAAAPALDRAWLPADYRAAHAGVPVESLVFVEANPSPEQAPEEVRFVQGLREREPVIGAIVAFVELLGPGAAAEIERLAEAEGVVGIRHNIQGNPPGFSLRPGFVEGVRRAGRSGLTFDLCATHDQLGEVVELARLCPDTRLVLDHCGKPPILEGALEPWAGWMARLAAEPHVWCKLSGLLTEADPERWRDEDLLPYAEVVAERFGAERLMYGSDWPVLTLASRSEGWYPFTRRFTGGWRRDDVRRFYHDNARAFYGLPTPQPDGP